MAGSAQALAAQVARDRGRAISRARTLDLSRDIRNLCAGG